MEEGIKKIIFAFLKNKDKVSIADIQFHLKSDYSVARQMMEMLRKEKVIGKKCDGIYYAVNTKKLEKKDYKQYDLNWLGYVLSNAEISALMMLSVRKPDSTLELFTFSEQIESLMKTGLVYEFEGEMVLEITKDEVRNISRVRSNFSSAQSYYIVVPTINYIINGGKRENIVNLLKNELLPTTMLLHFRTACEGSFSELAKPQPIPQTPDEAEKMELFKDVIDQFIGVTDHTDEEGLETFKAELDKLKGYPFLKEYAEFLEEKYISIKKRPAGETVVDAIKKL